MMLLRKPCDCFDDQFYKTEKRWKIFTIPFFTIITLFTLIEYPIEWRLFHFHAINEFLVISSIWLLNRYIIFKFHKKQHFYGISKFSLFLKYAITTCITLIIIYLDLRLFHFISVEIYQVYAADHQAIDIKHRLIYLIAVLFVYFINANYERLFLFMELSKKAVEAEKYKSDSIEARFKNLKSKINPHFLFNTFNALSEMIDENPQKANKLVQELSDVYRFVLDNQDINWVSLKEELEFARSYILLLKMRFEENLQTNINISDKLLNTYITPLTLQILIENAIKHNSISSKDILTIDIYATNSHIVVKNSLQKKAVYNSGTSFGLKNLHERYQHLVNKDIRITQTAREFLVEVPLIKEVKDESTGV